MHLKTCTGFTKDNVYISTLQSANSCWYLEIGNVGVFITQKLTNTTNQRFFFFKLNDDL